MSVLSHNLRLKVLNLESGRRQGRITSDKEHKESSTPDIPKAATAPDVPTIEAFEEDHNDSQQVIQSRNSFKYKSSHPEDQIIGNKESPRRTRSHFRPEQSALGLLSMIEPTKVDEALTDDGWILAMQDELNQFKRNDVWCRVIFRRSSYFISIDSLFYFTTEHLIFKRKRGKKFKTPL